MQLFTFVKGLERGMSPGVGDEEKSGNIFFTFVKGFKLTSSQQPLYCRMGLKQHQLEGKRLLVSHILTQFYSHSGVWRWTIGL